MAEQNDDALIREIEEDLRHEQAMKLWQAYGRYIIAAAVTIVVVVAGYQGWRAWDFDRRSNWTAELVSADLMADAGKTDDALALLRKLEADGSAGFQLMARLKKAGLLADKGQAAEAAKAFLAIAADGGIEARFRDLAAILGTIHEINAGVADAATVDARLAPYRDPKSAWRHSARELTALVALKAGDVAKAREQLQAITLDGQSPGGIRSRAQELLQAVGS